MSTPKSWNWSSRKIIKISLKLRENGPPQNSIDPEPLELMRNHRFSVLIRFKWKPHSTANKPFWKHSIFFSRPTLVYLVVRFQSPKLIELPVGCTQYSAPKITRAHKLCLPIKLVNYNRNFWLIWRRLTTVWRQRPVQLIEFRATMRAVRLVCYN